MYTFPKTTKEPPCRAALLSVLLFFYYKKLNVPAIDVAVQEKLMVLYKNTANWA